MRLTGSFLNWNKQSWPERVGYAALIGSIFIIGPGLWYVIKNLINH